MGLFHSPHHHHDGHAPHGKHSKEHHHHHGHGHGQFNYGRAFLIGITLNLIFVIVEWTYGVLGHSLALIADATHNLGDVLSLVLAWLGHWMGQREPSKRFTYGLRGTSILAALANGVLLMLVTGALAWEAVQRFSSPPPVAGMIVIVIALAGVVVNGLTAWLFMAGSPSDLNVRGAFLHMAADAAVSLGVAISGAIVLYTGWGWLDPAVTLLLVAVIALGAWSLLRDAIGLALQAVPVGIDSIEVRTWLAAQAEIAEVHDLHIWAMSTTENALTAHIVCPTGHPGDAVLQRIAHDIDHHFQIGHVTLQVELANSPTPCALAPDHVV